ncbi:MAG: MBL fold metallo-hydrolase [Deltaproteobacteria bacterium]|jgi:alkyl sulfatase BDS1-like metallo-beta-lactamase superfamily hydrolase|nr:MBL fold metallo-hydrolase [Deltaproteobacteria bacterium]
MGEITELAERAWVGELGEINVHPGRVLVAFEELAPHFGFMSAFSNALVLDTEEGLVFVDTSSFFHANQLFEGVRKWSKQRVHTGIYTHGHVDHVFGLLRFYEEAREQGWPETRIIAHRACPARFDRYVLTNGYNGIINARQFDFPKPTFPKEYRYPDETVSRERTLEVGGETIELRHDRGETDDHLWAWLPHHKAIYTGDLFIWAAPNCGNPQKAQRYPREWAQALRKMDELGAETLLPGHGPPILGADRVSQALRESAELLETLTEQTLAMMNEGAPLNDIMHDVVVPEALLERPYLRPIYDDPRFIVRNLWRLYGGWYDGNPAHLMPSRERDLARAVAQLAGGARALSVEAEARLADGDLAVACELAEFAWRADPDDAGVRGVRSTVYRARAEHESSLMAKGIFEAAARDSDPPTE